MDLFLDILSWICILTGSVVMLVGSLGLLRLPDVYSRMHGAGMTESLGAFLILLGMAFQVSLGVVTIKLALIFAFLMITNPTGTHALAQAAMTSGVLPETARNPEDTDDSEDPDKDESPGDRAS